MAKEYSRLWIDFETFSQVDITKHGGIAYTNHPSTQPVCMAFALDDEDVQVWNPSKQMPRRVLNHVAQGGKVYEHGTFDYYIWNVIMTRDFNWPEFPLGLDQVVDTISLGLNFTMPRKLEGVGIALQISMPKDADGKRLIKKCCCPRKDGSQPMSWDPGMGLEFKRLEKYCARDVEAMREAVLKLPRQELIPIEHELWKLTCAMNITGLPIAYKEVVAILNYIEKYIKKKSKMVPEKCGHAFQKITQVAKMQVWCKEQNYPMPNMQAATIIKALADPDIPENVRDMLLLRQELGRTSTAKYKKIKALAVDLLLDGQYHVYENLVYHGAGPGRWTGQGFQMHNLPRASVPDPEAAIKEFLDNVDIEDPVGVAKALIRPMICAPEGQSLMVSDYDSIENVLLAWLAGDEQTLQDFRDGLDQYVVMASARYGVPYDELYEGHKAHDPYYSAMRQMGKVIILGCIAEGTLVLTDIGPVPIEDIRVGHKLWDGDKWVNHWGVLDKGKKTCIKFAREWITPDHEVYIKDNQKEEAQWLLDNNTLSEKKAICLAIGKFLSTQLELSYLNEMLAIISSAPYVEKSIFKFWQILKRISQLSVELVDENIILIWIYIVKLQDLVKKLSIDSTPLKPDVIIQKLLLIDTMEVEVPQYVKNGLTNLKHFYFMLVPSLDMMTQTSSLEMLDSVQDYRILKTYDILESGNLNRFTILTKQGPILVSNCGYGMGWETFVSTALDQFGIVVTEDEAREAVAAYRDKYNLIKKLWNELKLACVRTVISGKRQTYGLITFATATVNGIRWLAMQLPSGKCIYYCRPRIQELYIPKYETMGKVPTVVHEGVNPYTKKWSKLKLIPGRITENAVQGTAREVMGQGMLNVQKRMPDVKLIGTVHDEALSLIPKELGGQDILDEFNKNLCDIPWAKGCPISSTGYIDKRYRKD